MQQRTASVVRIAWVALIVLLSGRVAVSQGTVGGFVGDFNTRVIARGLATSSTTISPVTNSTAADTNSCPDEAQACLGDESCSACFLKVQSTLCASNFLEGELTCDGVFGGFICCEFEDEPSCIDNELLTELFGERLGPRAWLKRCPCPNTLDDLHGFTRVSTQNEPDTSEPCMYPVYRFNAHNLERCGRVSLSEIDLMKYEFFTNEAYIHGSRILCIGWHGEEGIL